MELKFDPQNPDLELVTETKRVEELAHKFTDAATLGVDVETSGFDPYTCQLLSLQISMADVAYIFDPTKADLSSLATVLTGPKPLKILQNASFDYKFIKHHLGITLGNMYDTMLAERVLTTGKSRLVGLNVISQKYLNLSLDKAVRETFTATASEFSQEQLNYAALDVLVLPPILTEQVALLKKEGLVKVAHLEFQALPAVAEMEYKGIRLDIPKWREMFRVFHEKRDEVERKIQELLAPYYPEQQGDLFGGPCKVLNLNSPIQLIAAFKKVGLEIPSTGEAILKKTNHDLARLILEYRGYEKLISAFGESILGKINPVTKRLHPSFQQIGADTGRFSCSHPNLQQIPATSEFRDCFIPAQGYKFVVADYSQQELRVLAELTGDPLFKKAYNEDLDLHSLTASQMYGVPFSEFGANMDAEHKKLRQAAKIINFGIAYGMGPGALSGLLGVGVEESRGMLERYVKTYKGVKKWLDKVAHEAVKNGYSTTLLGRKRWYTVPEKDDPEYQKKIGDIERQGKNTPIQGSSADMTKFALVYILNNIREKKFDASPILAVHDEIVVEVREDQAEEMRDIVEREMVRAGKEMLPSVPVKTEAKVTDVWEH